MTTDAADEKDITRYVTDNKVYNIPSITLNQLFQRMKDHTESFFYKSPLHSTENLRQKMKRNTRERERERESARSEKIKWTSDEEEEHLRRVLLQSSHPTAEIHFQMDHIPVDGGSSPPPSSKL